MMKIKMKNAFNIFNFHITVNIKIIIMAAIKIIFKIPFSEGHKLDVTLRQNYCLDFSHFKLHEKSIKSFAKANELEKNNYYKSLAYYHDVKEEIKQYHYLNEN